MVSFITKTTLIDNWDSELKNHVEVIIGNKKAFIEHGKCTIINRDNIKNLEKYQAFKLAMKMCKNYYDFPFNKNKHY